jgi:hypothetical protein
MTNPKNNLQSVRKTRALNVPNFPLSLYLRLREIKEKHQVVLQKFIRKAIEEKLARDFGQGENTKDDRDSHGN